MVPVGLLVPYLSFIMDVRYVPVLGTPEYTDRYILFAGGRVGHFFDVLTILLDPCGSAPKFPVL